MDHERYTTYIPKYYRMIYFALGMVAVLVAKDLTENTNSRGMTLLIWAVALLLCVGLMRLVDFLFVDGELILTPEGIEKRRGQGPPLLPGVILSKWARSRRRESVWWCF